MGVSAICKVSNFYFMDSARGLPENHRQSGYAGEAYIEHINRYPVIRPGGPWNYLNILQTCLPATEFCGNC